MTVTPTFRDDVRPSTMVGIESDHMAIIEAQRLVCCRSTMKHRNEGASR